MDGTGVVPVPARPKVSLIEVTKVFGESGSRRGMRVLDKLSLDVGDGEFVCLLGPSGCGKSTILNLVAGFDAPTSGSVLMDGAPIVQPGLDRGVVFQEPLLFPWLNVIDNITLGPRLAGVPTADCLAEGHRYVGLMGLVGFDRHRPYELSGGMRQRVALARAWISKPEVLLMDEPFAALDAQTRLMMQELLLEVWAQLKTTVLFITHDVEEALFLADRVCVMSKNPGRISFVLESPLERPRTYEGSIRDPQFALVKRDVVLAVRREAQAGR